MKTPASLLAAALVLAFAAAEADPIQLIVQAGKPGAKISPSLYGLMTEEINHSYDGGLYGELIQNRSFKDNPEAPAHWSLVTGTGGAGSIALDQTQPVPATALTTCLRLDVTSGRAGAANDGYWGIPVKPETRYTVSFYAKAAAGFPGPLTITLQRNGGEVLASAAVPHISPEWKQYTASLSTEKVAPSVENRFVISANAPGTVWLNLVSLFTPTFNDRPNGNRIDLMQKLAAMKPAFLRFPGGNYLEGDTIPERFDWKKTLGPLPQRPGHQGPWKYRSTDGLGLLEFLEWCEDLKMEPLLAVYAGYSLHQQHVEPGPALAPYVQDALDEIEYITGGPATRWGAERVRDGHPAPFPLRYVEVGNEDNYDKSKSYDGRFTQFYDAIRVKYPRLLVIATARVKSRTPDLVDDHFYKSPDALAKLSHRYDNADRNGPRIFVGEWAAQDAPGPWKAPNTKGPTPCLGTALGDAAWMTGLERNSDLVILSCYAPLLVNVNPGARQWATNLIGYDALNSYGSPSYYTQKMFTENRGDVVLPVAFTSVQTVSSPSSPGRTASLRNGQPATLASGDIILKVVNMAQQPAPAQIQVDGAGNIQPTVRGEVLTGAPFDRNSIAEPEKIIPHPLTVQAAASPFAHEFPANSVTVLRFRTR